MSFLLSILLFGAAGDTWEIPSAWLAGIDEPVIRFGLPGYLDERNGWRCTRQTIDLKAKEHNVAFFHALSERVWDERIGGTKWVEPIWGTTGWRRGTVIKPFPLKFYAAQRRICRGTYCEMVETWRW